MIVGFDGVPIVRGGGRPDEIVAGEVRPSLAREARRLWGVENNIYQFGHRGYVAVDGGARDCPYSYMKDLVTKESSEMAEEARTKVIEATSMEWELMPQHVELYHREIVSAADADGMGVRASSVLWEKIGVGGAVLPHYHNVAEIIHITVGQVRLLCNGEWRTYRAGDTFHVPAGVVHSVVNDDTVPTEQISIFLPVEENMPANRFFETVQVPVPVDRPLAKGAK